jgi:hypothetical protein
MKGPRFSVGERGSVSREARDRKLKKLPSKKAKTIIYLRKNSNIWHKDEARQD